MADKVVYRVEVGDISQLIRRIRSVSSRPIIRRRLARVLNDQALMDFQHHRGIKGKDKGSHLMFIRYR